MKVAFVHDWLVAMRGGERALEVIAEQFPDAPILTLFADRSRVSPALAGRRILTTRLQRLGLRGGSAARLPQFMLAVRDLNRLLDDEAPDVVLSVSHCVAKAARAPHARHATFCLTPMRYAWDGFEEYMHGRPVRGLLACAIRPWLQRWDRRTAGRLEAIATTSTYVANRIWRVWGMQHGQPIRPLRPDAAVLGAPVDLDRFQTRTRPGHYFLVVSALVPYKRIDLAIGAANLAGEPLVVVGDGPERARLERIAGPTICFADHVSDEAVADWYAGCRALIFPGVEDFGLTPLECMASGRPVIAYGKGGALETVTSATGVLLPDQSAAAFASAMASFQDAAWSPVECRLRAAAFSRRAFADRIRTWFGGLGLLTSGPHGGAQQALV